MKYNSEAFDHNDPHDPICIGCNRKGADMPEYRDAALMNEYDFQSQEEHEAKVKELGEDEVKRLAKEYLRYEEGTYNHENGHFLCTPCYIEAGMPSSPRGWRAP